jgi:sec-independent protein translocase protein TatA
MPNVGPLEIAVVLIIVLIIFGPKRLPELGQSMGRGIREFKSSLSGDNKDKDSPEEKHRELEASQAAPSEAKAAPSEAKAAPGAAESEPAEPVEGEVVTENKA